MKDIIFIIFIIFLFFICLMKGRKNNSFKSLILRDEKFCAWAFGEDFKHKTLSKLREAWNIIHSHELTLEAHGLVEEDLKKMEELWKQRC